MRVVAFDTETCLFRPGVAAPEIVCGTWASPGTRPQIARWDTFEPILISWLEDDDVLLTGAHVAYDACVTMANYPRTVDLWFRAYRRNRVTDVQHRDRLLDIAAGRFQGYVGKHGWIVPTYDLASLSQRYRGITLNKPIFDDDGNQINDSYRLRYNELIYTPLEEWPTEARHYALEDAQATLEVHLAQDVHKDYLGEEFNTARKFLALQLKSVWGLRTDAKAVAELARKATEERAKVQERLVVQGLVRPNGKRNTKVAKSFMVAACRELKIAVPLTDTGAKKLKEVDAGLITKEQIEAEYASLAEDACKAVGDPVLKDYAAFGRWGSTLSKDVTALAKGTLYPIHTRFGMAATTRTTSSKPNMQNWGAGWGPRECFVPRRGKVFLQADYPQLELRTLAQVCMTLFGRSQLAKVLNAGNDPHTQVAATILGISYEEALKNKNNKEVKNARQSGKIANFGFPGGLGAKKLVAYAKSNYNVTISLEDAKILKAQWLRAFPEMALYFEYMGRLTDNEEGLGEILIPGSKQVRGGAHFCALCNTPFQGLGAMCSSRALWYLAEAYYVDRSSPLFGSRGVNHIHDENIVEHPDDPSTIHEAAWELARLMDKGANEYLPDVPIKTDPVVMRYWSKEAFAVSRNGRLVPWAGEWECEECHGIFTPPHPGPGKENKCCAKHTTPFAEAA